eukprot:166049-Pleurochrysis_carterae.AAC.3
MGQLTDRARNNKHRQERRNETQRKKRMRLAKGEDGTRVVSDMPELKIGGGKWNRNAPETRRHCSKETTGWTGQEREI